MNDPDNEAARSSIARQLVAMSLREHLLAHEAEQGGTAYKLGLRDAYAEAAAYALDPTGERVWPVVREIEDALTRGNPRDKVEAVAADVVQRANRNAGRSAPRLEWLGPVAFRLRHPGPPGADNDFGSDWGELHDQRISLRRDIGATSGLLYAYDPTWNEYAVLGTNVALAAVEGAAAQLKQRHGDRSVDEFAGSVAAWRPRQKEAARVTPALKAEL